jgi:hypothetical protein
MTASMQLVFRLLAIGIARMRHRPVRVGVIVSILTSRQRQLRVKQLPPSATFAGP